MLRWGTAAAVLLLVVACAGKSERTEVVPSPTASHAPAGTLTAASAQDVLDEALHDLRAGKTAGFEQVVTFGQGAGVTTVSQVGIFDLSRKAWQATLSSEMDFSPDLEIKPLRFIGTEQALYLTSSAWPSKTRGRWLRLDAADLRRGVAPGVPGDLSGGVPAAAAALFASEASSAERSDSGTTVEAELPASAAIALATLQFGVIKAHVDPTTLTGVVSARIEVTPNGQVSRLVLEPWDFNNVVKQLPAPFIKAFTNNLRIEVSYTRFATPFSLHIPLSKDLVTSSDLKP